MNNRSIENQFKLDNIVVKINYRLGIMGFMNTFDEEKGVPKGGNYGYMDQGAAIKDSSTTMKSRTLDWHQHGRMVEYY